MHDAVIEMARRAGIDPHFLAFALAAYAEQERLDEPALAAFLGATPDTLASARLCRMPRPGAFAEDVDRVAAKFGLKRDALAEAARRGLVVAEQRRAADAAAEPAAPFLAARDRTP